MGDAGDQASPRENRQTKRLRARRHPFTCLETKRRKKTDSKAEARASAARKRNRADREAAILAGLDDLDIWWKDQIDRGMAAFVMQCHKECRALAQRLVDAKAAGRDPAGVDSDATLHATGSGAACCRGEGAGPAAFDRPGIPATGYASGSTRERCAPSCRMDTTRDALFEDRSALRLSGLWRVVATMSVVQPDRLRRVETWLWCENGGDEAPRSALLLDFIPVATGAASSGYTIGAALKRS